MIRSLGVGSLFLFSISVHAFNLNSIDSSNGMKMIGDEDANSGYSVSSAGDFNNDGYDDIIIGAPYYQSSTGWAYLIYGTSDLSEFTDLSSIVLDGSNGFYIEGDLSADYTGISVSGAGDVNGDGYDDVLIGTNPANGGDGCVYLVYGHGQDTATSQYFSLLSIKDGSSNDGVYFIQDDPDTAVDHFGFSVSGAGDVNNDGYDDIIIGAYGSSSTSGHVYVIYGGYNLASTFSLSALDGHNGFVVTGMSGSKVGYSVSGAGDVNNDRYDDIIIGSSFYGTGASVFVIFGSFSQSATISTSSLNGDNGFAISSGYSDDYLGNSVSNAGDFNGDGYADMIIGAYGMDSQAGASYLLYGGSHIGDSGLIYASSITSSTGFIIEGETSSDQSGYSVSGIGDINNDGYDDVIIGAPYAHPDTYVTGGKSYILYGGQIYTSYFYLTYIQTSSSYSGGGLIIYGEETHGKSGCSVSGGGDFNGDGIPDVLIGALGATIDSETNNGATYLITDFSNKNKNNNNNTLPKLYIQIIVYIVIGFIVLFLIRCFIKRQRSSNHRNKDLPLSEKADFSIIVNASEVNHDNSLQSSLLSAEEPQQGDSAMYGNSSVVVKGVVVQDDNVDPSYDQ